MFSSPLLREVGSLTRLLVGLLQKLKVLTDSGVALPVGQDNKVSQRFESAPLNTSSSSKGAAKEACCS